MAVHLKPKHGDHDVYTCGCCGQAFVSFIRSRLLVSTLVLTVPFDAISDGCLMCLRSPRCIMTSCACKGRALLLVYLITPLSLLHFGMCKHHSYHGGVGLNIGQTMLKRIRSPKTVEEHFL